MPSEKTKKEHRKKEKKQSGKVGREIREGSADLAVRKRIGEFSAGSRKRETPNHSPMRLFEDESERKTLLRIGMNQNLFKG